MENTLSLRETRLRCLSDWFERKDIVVELGKLYSILDRYISRDPFFKITYEPYNPPDDPPEIIEEMASKAAAAGTGPMAAVAGAFAEHVGQFILGSGGSWVVVENGGDVFLDVREDKTVGIHAGESPLSNRLAFNVTPSDSPLGICTSSSSVGHSVSLGEADAVVAVAESTPLADAAATAIANTVIGDEGIDKGTKKAEKIPGLTGVLIIKDKELATWGKIPEIIEADFKVTRD